MGFLNLYDGTERIVVARDGATEYWVEIKQFLTANQYATAQKALMRPKVTMKDGQKAETEAQMESEAYQQALVKEAVTNWNLTGRDDQTLALTIENIRELPQVVFLKLYKRITDLNKSSNEGGSDKERELNGVGSEREFFREAERGDHDGRDGGVSDRPEAVSPR